MVKRKTLTLIIVYSDTKVLLGMKKRGFGEGRWNGFGGKVGEGESIEDATIRELEEEAGILVSKKDLNKRGILEFRFDSEPNEILEVHIFSSQHFEGEPTETEEMRPAWFTFDTIPFSSMWPDDIFWLPLLLEGKNFKGSFLFGEGDSVLENTLHTVDGNIL